jgi:hypothetical protein
MKMRNSLITTCVVLVLTVAACGGDGGSPTDGGTNWDGPIVFGFDESPTEFNPTFTKGPVTILFSTDTSVNAAGVMQFVDDFRAEPYRGKGNVRLTSRGSPQDPNVAVDMRFNIKVYTISCHAFQTDSLYVTKITTPFSLEFFDENDLSLGTAATTQHTSWRDPKYEIIQFPAAGGVRRIKLRGILNCSYLDAFVVSAKPPSS